jgi:hypothetical protein
MTKLGKSESRIFPTHAGSSSLFPYPRNPEKKPQKDCILARKELRVKPRPGCQLGWPHSSPSSFPAPSPWLTITFRWSWSALSPLGTSHYLSILPYGSPVCSSLTNDSAQSRKLLNIPLLLLLCFLWLEFWFKEQDKCCSLRNVPLVSIQPRNTPPCSSILHRYPHQNPPYAVYPFLSTSPLAITLTWYKHIPGLRQVHQRVRLLKLTIKLLSKWFKKIN